METMRFILDGHHGVYLPQVFVNSFHPQAWSIEASDFLALTERGPEDEYYWDTWEDVLNTARFVDENGDTWTLYQGESGDLFAVHENHEWED